MNIVVAFDTSDREEEIKKRLISTGYYASWTSGSNRYILPHNCVWKPDTELQTGKTDLERVITELNATGNPITLNSCIVLSAVPFVGKPSSP